MAIHHRRVSRRGTASRVLAALLATSAFAQQAISAPGDIFMIPAPVLGADPPKSRDLKVGDASVATQTGALQYSYPIQVPPGRNGMAPSLALTYSSQSAIYGTIAAGWTLSIPEIREDTSQGRLATRSSYYELHQTDPKADDRFTSSLAGGRPLIKVTEPVAADVYASYRAQNDTSFARYERMHAGQPYRWRVRTMDGSTFYFGETALTPACWNFDGYAPLTRSVDAFGNEITYEYESLVQHECRIKKITWGQNANAGVRQFAKIEFTWQVGARCADSSVAPYVGSQLDYRSGVKILTGASKLTDIYATAFAPGAEDSPVHTRRISLGYSAESESCTTYHAPMRLLTSVQESAWGTDAPQVDLPPVRFEYGSAVIELATGGTAAVPWMDYPGPNGTFPANLGWGSRAQATSPYQQPTVEAMMVDLNGDGLQDRIVSIGRDGDDCVASWQANLGPSGDGSALPAFGSGGFITLPHLRWGGIGANDYCALNGQVTSYDNILDNSVVTCHDGSNCQPSQNPKLNNKEFCYSPDYDEWGLQCPRENGLSSSIDAEPVRTMLAYRWLDVDADGLTDLVTAVHGHIRAMDIVQGNDSSAPIDRPPTGQDPFGPWPPCEEFDKCVVLERECIDNARSAEELKACIDGSPMSPCGDLVVTPYLMPGSPSTPIPAAPPQPYSRCEGLYPWFIYRNEGKGVLASEPLIKYSPVPLESEDGDSALNGAVVSSTGHGIFDFDGDGRLDAVKVHENGNAWNVWRGDGTGGFEKNVHVITKLTGGLPHVSASGLPSSYGDNVSAAFGTFDLNGDGLVDRWYQLDDGNANVAWNDGTAFESSLVSGSNPPAYVGAVTTPIAGTSPNHCPLKPGANTKFTVTETEPVTNRAEAGQTVARNRPVDVDVDGRVDVVDLRTAAHVYFNGGGNILATPNDWLGNWDGALRMVSADSGFPLPWQLYSDLIDLDGDGIHESISFPGKGELERYIHRVDGAPPRLLTRIDNGQGAVSSVVYGSMHDKSVVTQRPNDYWPDDRPKASPRTQWVVKSITTTDIFAGTTSIASQLYENPRYGADDEGYYSFRGFELVKTNTATGSQLVERFDYSVDWSGRLVETLVHPSPGSTEVRSIDRTTWTARTLFNGRITTYHAADREHYTCFNGHAEDVCEVNATGYTRTIIRQAAYAPTGGEAVLWHDTESILQSTQALADGDRQSVSTFALISTPTDYRFRPLTTTREHRVAGAWVMYGKTASTWDSDLKLKLTDEVWVDSIDENRAITRYFHDGQTGNLLERWKPEQNANNTAATTYTYDDRKLFVASETNEIGHQQDFFYDYGTGTKLRTDGPNVRTCVTGPDCPLDDTHPLKQQRKIRVDGLGRSIERWETVSEDGTMYVLTQFDRTTYAEASTATNIPASVTHEVRHTTSTSSPWTKEKTEHDGHGRLTKKTVYVGTSAPADRVSVFQYGSNGLLQTVSVPDPTTNDASQVTYRYGYDTLGRPTSIRRPDHTTPSSQSGVNIAYDGLSKITAEVVGAAGGVPAASKAVSDRYGRLVQVHEQIGDNPATFAITVYRYGPDDLVSSVVDPENVTTELVHDLAGRRTRITRHGRTWEYGYDRNGNTTSEIVPGHDGTNTLDYTTSIKYDALDRPIEKLIGQRDLSSADQQLFASREEILTYDVGGNMKGYLRWWQTYAPGSSTATITRATRRHDQGWLSNLDVTFNDLAGLGGSRNQHYRYMLFGGVKDTRYYDQVGTTNNYFTLSTIDYDTRALPSKITFTNAGEGTSQVLGVQTRNVAGHVTKRRTDTTGAMTFVESNWTYDKLGRITSQVVQKGPGPTQVARQDLTYFGNDDPSTLTHYLGTDAKQFSYTYDRRHQLTGVATNVAGYFDASYQYGTAGRFTRATEAQTISPLPEGTEVTPRDVNYVYGGPDPEQVTQLTDVATGTPFASYTYDAAGNQLSRCYGTMDAQGCSGKLTEYVYDGNDQLRRATKKVNGIVEGSEEYWYDGDGQRVAVVRRDGSGNKTGTLWFVGDTEAHYDAANALSYVYSYLTIGTPVARVKRTDGAFELEHMFHGLANSTLAAVAADGTVNTSFSYTPFGAVVEATNAGAAASGVGAHPRRHNDKFNDELTALAYYGVRYYDTTLIGWTQADPLYRFAPDAGWTQPRKSRLYTFTQNNPLRYIDPDGRDTIAISRMFFQAGNAAPHPVAKAVLYGAGVASSAAAAGAGRLFSKAALAEHIVQRGRSSTQGQPKPMPPPSKPPDGRAWWFAATAVLAVTTAVSGPYRDTPRVEGDPEILGLPPLPRDPPGPPDGGAADALVDAPTDATLDAPIDSIPRSDDPNAPEPTWLQFCGSSGSSDESASWKLPAGSSVTYTGTGQHQRFENPSMSSNILRRKNRNHLDKARH